MEYSHENEPNVGTAAEIRLVYEEAVDVSREIDTLKEQARQLDVRRSYLIKGLNNKITQTGLPQDAKILAAALLRFPKSAKEIQTEVEIMTEFSEKTASFAGQTAIWFSTKEYMTLHRFMGKHEYETMAYLNLGVLSKNASLEIGPAGELLIPLAKSERMPVEPTIWEQSGKRFEKIDIGTPLTEPSWTENACIYISPSVRLSEVRLVLGDEAVEDTISRTYSSTQRRLTEMKDHLSVKPR